MKLAVWRIDGGWKKTKRASPTHFVGVEVTGRPVNKQPGASVNGRKFISDGSGVSES